jgi:hypothetical protein
MTHEGVNILKRERKKASREAVERGRNSGNFRAPTTIEASIWIRVTNYAEYKFGR